MVKQLTTIGNLTVDDIIFYDTQQMFLNSIGGNAIYAAIGARVWDTPTTLVARIGRSFPGDSVQKLDAFGIKTCLVEVPYNDIRDWALYEPGGARQFINHLSSGTHYQMSITGDELPQQCLQADGYHIAPMPTDVQQSLIKRLHESNDSDSILSWDPHEDYLHKSELNRIAYDILKYVDLFLPSQEEVFSMYGSKDLKAAAREFAQAGPSVIAIKMSVEGSLVYMKETQQFYKVPIYPCRTVDPTGAGDSFCGGFLACYLKTKDPILSACCGTVSASFVIEHVGALNAFESGFLEAEKRLEYVNNKVELL